jgi:hypothetical protein
MDVIAGYHRSLPVQMDDMGKICLALLDIAHNQQTFQKLDACKKEYAAIDQETTEFREANEDLTKEILALDEYRASISKLLDAAFPPEAKKDAELTFNKRFQDSMTKAQQLIDKHVFEARSLEAEVATNLAKAQKIELNEIRRLKK